MKSTTAKCYCGHSADDHAHAGAGFCLEDDCICEEFAYEEERRGRPRSAAYPVVADAAYVAKRRAARRAVGRCWHCNTKALPGYTVCAVHRKGRPRKYEPASVGDVFGSVTVTANLPRGHRGRSDERVAWTCVCGAKGEGYVFNLRKWTGVECPHATSVRA